MSSTNSESDSLFGDDPVGGDLFGDEFGGGDELAITNVGSEDPKVTSLTFPTLSVAVPFGGLSLPLSLPTQPAPPPRPATPVTTVGTPAQTQTATASTQEAPSEVGRLQELPTLTSPMGLLGAQGEFRAGLGPAEPVNAAPPVAIEYVRASDVPGLPRNTAQTRNDVSFPRRADQVSDPVIIDFFTLGATVSVQESNQRLGLSPRDGTAIRKEAVACLGRSDFGHLLEKTRGDTRKQAMDNYKIQLWLAAVFALGTGELGRRWFGGGNAVGLQWPQDSTVIAIHFATLLHKSIKGHQQSANRQGKKQRARTATLRASGTSAQAPIDLTDDPVEPAPAEPLGGSPVIVVMDDPGNSPHDVVVPAESLGNSPGPNEDLASDGSLFGDSAMDIDYPTDPASIHNVADPASMHDKAEPVNMHDSAEPLGKSLENIDNPVESLGNSPEKIKDFDSAYSMLGEVGDSGMDIDYPTESAGMHDMAEPVSMPDVAKPASVPGVAEPFSMHDLAEPLDVSAVDTLGIEHESFDSFLDTYHASNLDDIIDFTNMDVDQWVGKLVDNSLGPISGPSTPYDYTPGSMCDIWDGETCHGSPEVETACDKLYDGHKVAFDTTISSLDPDSTFDTTISSVEPNHTLRTSISSLSSDDSTNNTSISSNSPTTRDQSPNPESEQLYQARLGSFVDAVSSKMKETRQAVSCLPRHLAVPATAEITYLVQVFSQTTGLACDESLQFTHQDIPPGAGAGVVTQLKAMMEKSGLSPTFQVFTPKGRREVVCQSTWDEAILDIYNGSEMGETPVVAHMFV